jgi:hypothetical protein
MRNRRECIRCALTGVSLEPSTHGETLDVSETGIAWLSPEPYIPGDVITLESPALSEALGLPGHRLVARVRDLAEVDETHWRIGAELVAPSEKTAVALRRTVLRLQRQGHELGDHVVDVLVLPHL